MKRLLEDNGWEHYKTGCSCNGYPRFFRHIDYPNYVIILRRPYFAIILNSKILIRSTHNKLEATLEKYELIQKDTAENQDMDA